MVSQFGYVTSDNGHMVIALNVEIAIVCVRQFGNTKCQCISYWLTLVIIHYNDVIMSDMVPQITSLTIV